MSAVKVTVSPAPADVGNSSVTDGGCGSSRIVTVPLPLTTRLPLITVTFPVTL